MAFNIPGLKFLSKADAKSRVFFLLAAIVGLSFLIYLGARFFSGGKGTTGPSKVAGAPAGLQSVPGSQLSPEYYRALVQANAQAAQQAQITGSSAVPTLINVSGQQSGFSSEKNCTIICPNDENVNVVNSIAALVKAGKLSQKDADLLIDLAKKQVPVNEYAAALDELVRAGKLTPEQARQLLEEYKKQHGNDLITASAQTMDAMIKSGQLPLSAAAGLLALQKSHLSPAEYANELQRLVKEGKISPDTAARLLSQYTQQNAQEVAKQGLFQLAQMTRTGQITPDVAKNLAELQAKNVPLEEYAAELNGLVAGGKLTPATAAELLNNYKAQKTGMEASALFPVEGLEDMVKAGKISPEVAQLLQALQDKNVPIGEYEAELNRLVKEGKLTPEAAAALLAHYKAQHINGLPDMIKAGKITAESAQILQGLQDKNVSSEEYGAELNKLMAEGKLTPAAAAELLSQYKAQRAAGVMRQLMAKGSAGTTEAKRLLDMQANNATLSDYTDELKRAVQAGILTPEMAASLLQQYQAMMAPIAFTGEGAMPVIEGNIPGSADFAKLQQHLGENQPASVPVTDETQQFQLAQAQAEAQALQARQERIQQLASAMSNQVQSLLTAWTPPAMQHQAGTPPQKSSTASDKAGSKGKNSLSSSTRPIIKAGTILFAILDTAVDSDYPDTPVMATIVQGKFKGAKLLGKLALAQNQDRVSLNFTLLDMDDWPQTKSISAFAIDPDTARTVLASNVDYHYLKRYGALFASSFLSGYANAIQSAGSTQTTGIFGTSSTRGPLSPGDKIAVGLGQVGTTFSSAIASYVNTPTTVKVNSGVGLGILFVSDVAG